jgi:hypothetical protein
MFVDLLTLHNDTSRSQVDLEHFQVRVYLSTLIRDMTCSSYSLYVIASGEGEGGGGATLK